MLGPDIAIGAQVKTLKSSTDLAQSLINNKVFSARSCFERGETKEVVYENKIFNIKKKFTVAHCHNEFYQQKKLSVLNDQRIRAKPSEVFAKHIDNIVKNRRLLRRGVWETPIQVDSVVESKGRRRYKTEKEETREQQFYRSVEDKKKISQSTRNLEDEKQNQLPMISSGNHEIDLPIRLSSRYGTKPICSKTTEISQAIQIRNAMNRKLAVELINYNLLGKWASSSLKI